MSILLSIFLLVAQSRTASTSLESIFLARSSRLVEIDGRGSIRSREVRLPGNLKVLSIARTEHGRYWFLVRNRTSMKAKSQLLEFEIQGKVVAHDCPSTLSAIAVTKGGLLAGIAGDALLIRNAKWEQLARVPVDSEVVELTFGPKDRHVTIILNSGRKGVNGGESRVIVIDLARHRVALNSPMISPWYFLGPHLLDDKMNLRRSPLFESAEPFLNDFRLARKYSGGAYVLNGNLVCFRTAAGLDSVNVDTSINRVIESSSVSLPGLARVLFVGKSNLVIMETVMGKDQLIGLVTYIDGVLKWVPIKEEITLNGGILPVSR